MSVVDLLLDSIPNGSLLIGQVLGQKTKFVCTNLFQKESTDGEVSYVAEIRRVSDQRYPSFSVEDSISVPLSQIKEIRVLLPRFLAPP